MHLSAVAAAMGVAAMVLAAMVLASMGGCAETGDLGRPRASLWNSTVYPVTGYATAHLPREQISRFHLTDDETRLRDRAFIFNTAEHERLGFFEKSNTDVTAYHRAVTTETYASQVSRYRRLANDAAGDRGLIRPFRFLAGCVVAADNARLRTAALSPRVDSEPRKQASVRAAENLEVVERVREKLRARVESYRYALDNLVVEVPSREAITAERAVIALEAETTLLNRIPLLPLVCETGETPPGSLAGPSFGREQRETHEVLVPHPQSQSVGPPVITKY